MQLFHLETSTNIIGFDFLAKPKIEEYIRFNSLTTFTQPGYYLDDENNNNTIIEFELGLNNKILYEKRQYVQFIDVLGEVGGLMEIISSFFGFICNLIGDILYEKNIANNLFTFDIKKKLILIKKRNKSTYNIINYKASEKVNFSDINESSLYTPNKIKFKKKLKFTDAKIKNINDKNSENYLIQKKNILETQFDKNEIEPDINNNELNKNDIINKNGEKVLTNFTSTKKLNFFQGNDNKKYWIIDIINLKDLFISICFCFSRKRKNIYKLLLNETKEIITEKFDILNIFRDLCSIEDIKKYSEYNFKSIKMSDECINNLWDKK